MSNQQHTPEPFGFFRAEPFGWTDCAETDEGAQPLFDQAAIDAISKQRDELLADVAEETAVREKLATLLAETAVALKGPEAALFRHSWHDLAEVAAGVVKQRDELLTALEECRFALEPYDDIKPRDWKTDRERLARAHQTACAAIASVKGGAAQASSQVLNIDPTGIERDCCGTFFRSPHRSTCKKYRGKKGTPK